jgi:hypothetical protein
MRARYRSIWLRLSPHTPVDLAKVATTRARRRAEGELQVSLTSYRQRMGNPMRWPSKSDRWPARARVWQFTLPLGRWNS